MIEKTIALALRILPYSETSLIVTWLTPDQGRVATLLKGACRPKSPFLGQVAIPDLSELLFYTRDTNGLHIAKECARDVRRDAVRQDWRRYAAADYVCQLLLQVSVPSHHSRALYALAQDAFDLLNHEPVAPEFMLLCEMRLLSVLGMTPHLGSCLACGLKTDPRSTASHTRRWLFSPSRGGLLCEGCARQPDAQEAASVRRGDNLLAAAPDAVAILRRWGQALTLRSACRIRCTPAQRAAIHRLLTPFLAHHLDLDLKSRAAVAAMVAPERKQST